MLPFRHPMMFVRAIPFFVCSWLLVVFANLGCAQAILPSRTWTNNEGRTLKAELLKFTQEINEKGIVRLRLRSGSTVPINPGTLSNQDLSIILKAWFDSSEFRRRYNKGNQSHFFYSNEVSSKDADKSAVAYIGNDVDSSWLRLRLGANRNLITQGQAVVFVDHRDQIVRIPYTQDDIENRQSTAVVDLSLTKHKNQLLSIWAAPANGKLYIEDKSKKYLAVKLSNREKVGFREITQAFSWLDQVSDDPIWWETLTGQKPPEKPEPTKGTMAPEPQKPITELKNWALEKSGEVFEAEVMAFDRQQVNFRTVDGSSRKENIADLNRGSRMTIAKVRLEHTFKPSWHPFENDHQWFWPKAQKSEDNGKTAFDQPCLLFALAKEDDKPTLILQTRYPNQSGTSIESARLMAEPVALSLDLSADEGRSHELRSDQHTTTWYMINQEEIDLLMIAAPGIEAIEIEVTSSKGKTHREKLTDSQFRSTLEAIEIYRTWHSASQG